MPGKHTASDLLSNFWKKSATLKTKISSFFRRNSCNRLPQLHAQLPFAMQCCFIMSHASAFATISHHDVNLPTASVRVTDQRTEKIRAKWALLSSFLPSFFEVHSCCGKARQISVAVASSNGFHLISRERKKEDRILNWAGKSRRKAS